MAEPIIDLRKTSPLSRDRRLFDAVTSEPVGRYLENLPVIFQDNDFLKRFLQVFATIWEPLEQRQDHIAFYFDPRTCPAAWLPWLASWFALPVNQHWPEARLRAMVTVGFVLQRWRGTKFGLEKLLEACVGYPTTISEIKDQPFVYRITISVPVNNTIDEEFVEQLIHFNKPAHIGFEILEVEKDVLESS